MGRMDGKVAFITGAARGQGATFARAFAEEGADIIMVDACAPVGTCHYTLGSKDELDAVADEIRALGRGCVSEVVDVRDQASLDSVVARGVAEFGRLDTVIANAGIASFAPFWEMSDQMWNDMIDINLTGVWRTAKAAAPTLIQQKSGSMILISSVNGKEPLLNYCHYTAAKHGVLGLAKSFALELGPHNVRVNSILPGPVDTYLNSNPDTRNFLAGHENATVEEMHAAIRHWTLLRGRGALPQRSTANAALFLASDEAEHIHGLEMVVDAGHVVLPGFNHEPIDPNAS
jgi:SDR family mycofactocin-dependent oxidoreductase